MTKFLNILELQEHKSEHLILNNFESTGGGAEVTVESVSNV